MRWSWFAVPWLLVVGCETSDGSAEEDEMVDHGPAVDPDSAPVVTVDRFAEARAANPQLPGAGEAIDFDLNFFNVGLGPDGEPVSYYGLGPATGFTMPVYMLVDSAGEAIEGQLPIVSELPGAVGYSDFWQRTNVEVPPGYQANTITSAAELIAADYPMSPTVEVHNRPLVPPGSTADLARDDGLAPRAWFDDQVVHTLSFAEAPVRIRGSLVDYAGIFVCRESDGSFCVDSEGGTHNVITAVPGDEGYSPLWRVSVFPKESFDDVTDLESARAVEGLQEAGMSNCPLAEW